MTWRVLLVDDDAEILSSLLLRGRRHRERWSFVGAPSGAAAIGRLEAERFDVVLTDLRMPGLGGEEVLGRARALQPKAMRLVLSGRADRWLARDAVNAHQVFTKPADLDDVLRRAELALVSRTGLTEDEVEALTSGVGVPPSPRVFASLHAALASPDYRIESVARIVEQDLALTSRVLKLASSSALGPRRTVSSVRSAVFVLGQDALEQLVLLEEAMPSSQRNGEGHLRDHALLVGRLAVALDPGTREGFVAGVLHDLGHRVCDERDEAGGRHTVLGSYLAALWGFPASIVEAIQRHHDPPRGTTPPPLATLVWAADQLADRGSAALEGDGLVELVGSDLARTWREAGARFFERPTLDAHELGCVAGHSGR
ncbi:MAG: HDOD domain-containing protein [Polyangiaceae bacterium]